MKKIQLQNKNLTNNEKSIWNTYGRLFYRPAWKRSKWVIFGSIVEPYFIFSRYFSFGLFNSIGLGWCFACNNVRWKVFFYSVLYVAPPPPPFFFGCNYFNWYIDFTWFILQNSKQTSTEFNTHWTINVFAQIFFLCFIREPNPGPYIL
jgi:hypothetical protein